MNRFVLSVTAKRGVTRDGSHPDDEVYMTQVADTVTEELERMQFTGHLTIQLMPAPGSNTTVPILEHNRDFTGRQPGEDF